MNTGPDVRTTAKVASLLDKAARVDGEEQKEDDGFEGEDSEAGERSEEDGPSSIVVETNPEIDTDVRTPQDKPPLTRKQRRNQVNRGKWRVKRDSQRSATGTGIKSCAKAKVQQTIHSPDNVDTSFIPPPRAWTGPRRPPTTVSDRLNRVLKMPGMRLIEWRDKRQTRLIRDGNGRRLAVLAGWPSDDFGELITRVHAKCQKIESLMKKPASQRFNRRGPHAALPTGVSFGGGQEEPTELRNDTKNAELLREFLEDPDVQRVARYHDYIFRVYFPELHALYRKVLDKIVDDNPNLHPNFDRCCFAAATLNMGRVFTRRHLDHLNLYCGLCSVSPTGTFDYTKGGHLVLWDLKLIIEVPPGCTVLFPSALIEHSNIPIGRNEERSSFVQYSASGLFRWVNNGCMSNKSFKERASEKQLQAWEEHKEALIREGLKL
ncbi:hypothetical protein V5O48_011945 [Marasmius crinis-equi]|uniref:Prolyl 4-hydroxylase alpha subunit domain-containing protein n=1 Tax=Marasmius crinis-equi TaxID=585013 RepID=A0ABR3F4B6_9AGAR